MLSHGYYREMGRSAEGLYRFYEMRSWFIEGQRVFEQTAQALSGAAHKAKPKTGPKTEHEGEESAVLGQALAFQGWFHARLGQREMGVSHLLGGSGDPETFRGAR
jgi:hypothetical protein